MRMRRGRVAASTEEFLLVVLLPMVRTQRLKLKLTTLLSVKPSVTRENTTTVSTTSYVPPTENDGQTDGGDQNGA
jgi:hypothetical protein